MSDRDEAVGLPSANQRFKDAWRRRVRHSLAVALTVHLALLFLSFNWQLPYRTLMFSEAPEELLLFPGFGSAELPGTMAGVQDSVPGDLDEAQEEEEEPEGTQDLSVVGSDEQLADAWEALGNRLRGRGAPRPTLAEPELAPEEEQVVTTAEASVEGTGEGPPSIGGDASMAALAELPEPDSLRLDRLSTLRPELAFMTASAWVLIRNQSEVEAYLRRSYQSGRLDPGAQGSVSVTLWIDRSGSVEWAEVSKSSGRNDLDEFTLALFNEIVAFRAARDRGVYVSRSVTFSVNYPW